MKKLTITFLTALTIISLTGCKEEWQKEPMTRQWYEAHPKEASQLTEECKQHGKKTPACMAVNDFNFREEQKNAPDREFSFGKK